MSLILDALQRAQRERPQPPGTGLPPMPGEAIAGPARPLRWVLLALAATALGIAAGYVLRGEVPSAAPVPATVSATQPVPPVSLSSARPGERAVPTAVQAAPEAGSAPATPAAAVPEPASDPPRRTADAVPADVMTTGTAPPQGRASADPEVAALYARQRAAEAAAAGVPPAPAGGGGPRTPPVLEQPVRAPLGPAPDTVAAAAPPERAAPASRSAERAEAPSAPAAPPAANVEALLAAVEAELQQPQKPVSDHPVPLLEQLSQQQKDAIPSLMYRQHEYLAEGDSRVLLNRQVCAEGDSVAGVRVLEILPDSVVLEHQGLRFRLRALNSWVNF